MKLSLNILGYEIATLELESDDGTEQVTVVDRGVKKLSKWWMRGVWK